MRLAYRSVEAMSMARPFFTIGHPTHTIGAFVGLLGDAGVRLVVDVRTVP